MGGSGCSHHKRAKSAVTATDTLPLGRPLKGILKNNQCSTLPRQNCSCTYLGEVLPEPPELSETPLPISSGLLRSLSHDEAGDDIVYYSSANISTCDASEKLNQHEVLENVESSV